MKNHGSFPVAQPKSFGTTVSQSSTHIPTPACATLTTVRSIQPSRRIEEFDYLRIRYRKATFYSQLEILFSMPVLIMTGRSGKEWTHFAQEITDRAMFTQANAPGQIYSHDACFSKDAFDVGNEISNTLIYFTRLYHILGHLGRIHIPIHLDGEYKKQSSPGGESGVNFIYALQGFLLEAEIGLLHKQHVNDWINKRLPKCDWIVLPELHPTMRVSGEQPKLPKRKPRVCPSTFEEALAGGFKPPQLAKLVSNQHLAFYDASNKQAFAEPGQWASLYWALFTLGYIQKISAGKVPDLIAASFCGITSKSSVSAVKRKDFTDEVLEANSGTASICNIIKTHFSVK